MWDEIMNEMAKIARIQIMKSGIKITTKEE
jgi:hypothetical protein